MLWVMSEGVSLHALTDANANGFCNNIVHVTQQNLVYTIDIHSCEVYDIPLRLNVELVSQISQDDSICNNKQMADQNDACLFVFIQKKPRTSDPAADVLTPQNVKTCIQYIIYI